MQEQLQLYEAEQPLLQALLDDESLDAFVDDHSEKFKAYSADGEQSLEWGACHMAYVKLVEQVTMSEIICVCEPDQAQSPRGESTHEATLWLAGVYSGEGRAPGVPTAGTLSSGRVLAGLARGLGRDEVHRRLPRAPHLHLSSSPIPAT